MRWKSAERIRIIASIIPHRKASIGASKATEPQKSGRMAVGVHFVVSCLRVSCGSVRLLSHISRPVENMVCVLQPPGICANRRNPWTANSPVARVSGTLRRFQAVICDWWPVIRGGRRMRRPHETKRSAMHILSSSRVRRFRRRSSAPCRPRYSETLRLTTCPVTPSS